MSQRILVLGSGDVGSAVAHRLFLTGADVVLADEAAPAAPRRGMAFTDAWFDGTATLEGVVGLLVADVGDLAAQCTVMDAIPCTAGTVREVAAAWRPDALVDARMRKRAVPEDLRALAPRVIGLGPGFTPGLNCSAAIETAWGDDLGAVLRERTPSKHTGESRSLDGVGRERFVYAPQAGVWRTHAHIGDKVLAGAEVGTLRGEGAGAVHAPLTGALRGLSHDGILVHAGQKLLEVDPRPEPDTHGLGTRPVAIARGVLRALGMDAGPADAFFGFEASYRETMDCMPMSMRHKLDRCGHKLSLAQWRTLSRAVREALVEVPDSPRHIARLRGFLQRRAEHAGWPEGHPVAAGAAADDPATVPMSVRERCAADGQRAPSATAWASLTPLQRYALTKLTQQGSLRNWRQAMAEFGLVGSRPES